MLPALMTATAWAYSIISASSNVAASAAMAGTARNLAIHGSALAEQSISKKIRVAVMCMGAGEEVSGFNKICYYDCLGSRTAITIKSTSLCPLTINR
jgi:hypothetical protein